MQVTKTDLSLKHYSWAATSGDNPRITGSPDSNLFSRQEGYEVINMIQAVVNTMALPTQGDIHRLERLIHDDLPATLRSRQGVKDWLIVKMKAPRSFQSLLTDS